MASKMGIAVGGGVIAAHYTGEAKVIVRNHCQVNCSYKAGDLIVQLMVERIEEADTMEVDDLAMPQRGGRVCRSSDLNPKRSITMKEERIPICFLQAESNANEFFSARDIGCHPQLIHEKEVLSSPHVNGALTRTMNDTFLNSIRLGGKEDGKWLSQGHELVRLRERRKKILDEWTKPKGLLYYKNRLYIREDESLQTEIAHGSHNSRVARSFGQEKPIRIVIGDFYRKGLADWTKDHVRSCDECQPSKSPRHAKYGLVQPLEVPYAAWSSIATDFIMQLPESQSKTQIMFVVDRFTKMDHFIGLHENVTVNDVAATFLREVCKLHGVLTEIISGMDAKFSGEFGESLCKMLGVKRRMSTAYHAQTDRQTGRTNQVPEGYLQTFVNYG